MLFASFLALLVFLTAAMDNPFRGEFSISPDVFQAVLDNVMEAKSGAETGPRLPHRRDRTGAESAADIWKAEPCPVD